MTRISTRRPETVTHEARPVETPEMNWLMESSGPEIDVFGLGPDAPHGYVAPAVFDRMSSVTDPAFGEDTHRSVWDSAYGKESSALPLDEETEAPVRPATPAPANEGNFDLWQRSGY